MTTDELIRALRENAMLCHEELEDLLIAAANRLEELDERVAIMMEGKE